MKVTKGQARRALRSSEFEWSEEVEDPRREHNQRHEHHGLMSLLAGAFACGMACLRRVEDFSADLCSGTRRRLGLQGSVSDTTLHRLLGSQSVAGLRESAWKKLRQLIASRVICNDLFHLGVVSYDGKSLWASSSKTVKGAKLLHDKKHRVITSTLMSERAVLTSSQVRPCLDAEVIGEGTGESPAFRKSFPRVLKEFGDQFKIVTGDAGLTCSENARMVESAGKHYLFTLGKNLHRLYAHAESVMRNAAVRVSVDERRDGDLIRRDLTTVAVAGDDELNFPGAQQIWMMRLQVVRNGEVVSDKVRYFLSSLPSRLLSPTQQLALIRLHWGIENGHNWTMDVALKEDDRQPCQLTREAIEVVGWLRIIGYNLLAAWRSKLPLKDKKRVSWQRCMELLRDAFVIGGEVSLATP